MTSAMWKHAFMNDVSQFQTRWEGLRATSSDGPGMLAQGTRDWRDYEVAATVTPLLAEAWGLAACVQGRERYYAVMFDRVGGGRVRLIRRRHSETVLAERSFPWSLDNAYALGLRVDGPAIRATIDGTILFEVQDRSADALEAGGVALIVDTGSIATEAVRVKPSGYLRPGSGRNAGSDRDKAERRGRRSRKLIARGRGPVTGVIQ